MLLCTYVCNSDDAFPDPGSSSDIPADLWEIDDMVCASRGAVRSIERTLSRLKFNIRNNNDFLRSIDRQHIVGSVFNMLVAGVCCLKHEGFHEEREWRAIYAPSRLFSPLIEFSTETIDGIPQVVYKLPLDVAVSDTLADLDLSRMFDRLIIGPSQFSWPIYQAFVAELKKVGAMKPTPTLRHKGSYPRGGG